MIKNFDETKTILTISNLNFYYGNFHALKNINMKILKNNITSLIGPSGCGKSTLLKVLNRMSDLVENTKVEGEVIYKNKNIFSNDCDILTLRKEIGMVFQTPNPFSISIADNIKFGPKIHGETNKEKLDYIVENSLRAVGLWEHLKDKLNQPAISLKFDEQQKLCIARLIAVEPEILLMDEPCSALDSKAIMEIEDLMLELKKNYTIIIVTHNMQQAARISDYTGFMLLGELIEFNDTKILFSNPSDKRTNDYISGHYG